MHPIDEIISLTEQAVASGSKKSAKLLLEQARLVKTSDLKNTYVKNKARELINVALEAASANFANAEHWQGLFRQDVIFLRNLKNEEI